MKSMNISSGSRRWNFLKQVIAMLIGDEIVPSVRKWYKVAKRIIEIIAPSGLHWDKKRDRSVSAAVFFLEVNISFSTPSLNQESY